MGDGRYYVILPFELKLLDGSSFMVPVDSIINADLSIQLPDGSTLLSSEFLSPPDIQTLLGPPATGGGNNNGGGKKDPAVPPNPN
jgi:hypothetical protein